MTGPDRSMADFFWCMMAAQRGWSIEETASKLLEVSAKAQVHFFSSTFPHRQRSKDLSRKRRSLLMKQKSD
jgi:hypothetical protein